MRHAIKRGLVGDAKEAPTNLCRRREWAEEVKHRAKTQGPTNRGEVTESRMEDGRKTKTEIALIDAATHRLGRLLQDHSQPFEDIRRPD